MEWSPALERALERAADESRHLGHRRVGSEHLLLALLAEPEGAVAMVLPALQLEWGAVRAEIQELMPGSRRPVEGDVPLTDSAAGAVKRAEGVARRLRMPVVDTDHLLLGIANQYEGAGARVLLDFGATPEKIRQLVERETTERQTSTCSHCGAHLETAWRYCPMCGTARVAT
jgi:ATP-dependent Clp protease ATP-binding subunit ClpA